MNKLVQVNKQNKRMWQNIKEGKLKAALKRRRCIVKCNNHR